MNKRMREPFHMLMHRASTGYNDSWSQVDPEVLEKFAEAIVNECNKIITHGSYRSRGSFGVRHQETPAEIVEMIREHFKFEDEDDIENLKKTIAEIEKWEKDPMAAAQRYQQERIVKYGRDPFAPSSYSGSTQDQMAKWQPHYGTKEQYIKQLATAEEFAKLYPNLKSDFKEIQSMVSGIDEDLMKAMFDDHVKVVVSASGIETEEYQHD